MTPKAASEQEQADPSGAQSAIERYRDLAKYLITVFAGVGGLLVAGTQLSSIGALDLDTLDRLIAAAVGFIVAIGAVIWIVWSALSVLRPVELSLDQVVDLEQKNKLKVKPETLGPFASTAELRDVLAMDVTDEETHKELEKVADAVVGQVAFDKVKKRFECAALQMLFGAILATAGIVAFVWGANPPANETADPIVRPVPVPVVVSLTIDGRDVLEGALGKSCDLSQVAAISIGGTEETPRVVTLEQDGCKLAQFSLPADWGTARSTREAPALPSQLPAAEPEGSKKR